MGRLIIIARPGWRHRAQNVVHAAKFHVHLVLHKHRAKVHGGLLTTIGASLIYQGAHLADLLFLALSIVCEIPPEPPAA